MQLLNRFQPIRFSGQTASHVIDDASSEDRDFSEIKLPEDADAYQAMQEAFKLSFDDSPGDCFDGSNKHHQIALPADNQTATKQQKEAHSRMQAMLKEKIAPLEKERKAVLKELALVALQHSLLSDKNDMLLYGSAKDDQWNDRSRQLKQPPQTVQGSIKLGVEALLDTKASTWDSLRFDSKVHNLYCDILGNLYDQKPIPKTTLRTLSAGERELISQNIRTKKQLEQDIEKLKTEKLDPLEDKLLKHQAEADLFQSLA